MELPYFNILLKLDVLLVSDLHVGVHDLVDYILLIVVEIEFYI
jgi:hypothetical protein